jgi:hypothetical protein
MREVNIKQKNLLISNLNGQIEGNSRAFTEKKDQVVDGI